MERITVNDAEIGMKVKLRYPDPYYTISESNPSVGSEYECAGEVYDVGPFIHVAWENGCSNSYKSGELVIIEDIGKCNSVW